MLKFVGGLLLLLTGWVQANELVEQRQQWLDDGKLMRDVSLDRLQHIRFAFREMPAAGQQWSPWVRALAQRRSNSAQNGLADLQARTQGVVIGLDRPLYDQWMGGALLGVLEGRGEAGLSQWRSDQQYLGLYAATRIYYQLGLKVGALHAWQQFQSTSHAQPAQTVRGRGWQGFAEFSYAMDYQRFSLEPYLGWSWQEQHLASYQASGFYQSASAASRSELSLGWRLTRPWAWRYGRLIGRVNLSWHERLAQGSGGNDRWSADGRWQPTVPRKQPTSSVRASLSLDQPLAKGSYLGVGYSAQLAKGERWQELSARLSWRF